MSSDRVSRRKFESSSALANVELNQTPTAFVRSLQQLTPNPTTRLSA